jgi:Protein of unknown function (DUF1648)
MRFIEPTELVAPRTRLERVLQGVSALAVVISAVHLSQVWERLPARIPRHFGWDGTVDGWGDRGALWVLPALGLALVIGLSLLERVPHLYNYPVKLTESTRGAAYVLGRQFVCGVKAIMAVTFSYLTFAVTEVALGASSGPGPWFTPALLAAVFGWLGVFWIQLRRRRQGALH